MKTQFFSAIFLTINLGAVFFLGGCRSTAGKETSEVAEIAAAKDGNGLKGGFSFTKKEAQELYLQMVATESANGEKIIPGQLHSSKGVMPCQKDGSLDTCSVQVRLQNGTLSPTQPVPRPLSVKIAAHVRQVRPDLATEKQIVGDLYCDYIGKKSPPFDIEDATCHLLYPRALNEVIFEDFVAEDISEGLRGGTSFGTTSMTLRGTLVCLPKQAAHLGSCLVRSIVGGTLQEKVHELPQRSATPASKKLLQALIDYNSRTAPDAVFTEPAEIMTTVTCEVSSDGVETTGKRLFVCRAQI